MLDGLKKGSDGRTIGQRIGYIREMKGLTQQSLADEMGVPREDVRNWENDKRRLKYEAIVAITNALGISADYLLGLSYIQTKEPELRAVCEYTGLNENAVGLLHLCAERGYRTHNPYQRINDLFCQEGVLFLAALDRIEEEVFNSERSLNRTELSPDEISKSLDDLGLSIYRLSQSAQKLANCLFGVEALEKRLNDAYYDISTKCFEEYQRAIEEAENGKHQEN